MIKYVYHGYAYPTTNGVPTLPSSAVLSPGVRNDPYPFSVSKARALLAAHGWDVSTDPGTCVEPGTGAGECGAGIGKGEKLSFDVEYANGTSYLPPIMQALQSDAGLAGKALPGGPVRAILGTRASDPVLVKALTIQLGLNKPIWSQYWSWLDGSCTATSASPTCRTSRSPRCSGSGCRGPCCCSAYRRCSHW